MTGYTKDTLRQEVFAKRTQQPLSDRKSASQKITDIFFNQIELPPKDHVISGYSPVNGEVDVREIMVRLCDMGYTCTIPYTAENGGRLLFLEWHKDLEMESGIYGIPEPDPKISAEHIPDFLIMPLLAFDDKGNRLGYGSGVFDRTFEHLLKLKSFRTVGVAFELQHYADVPVDQHDYPLDTVITEKQIYDFKKA